MYCGIINDPFPKPLKEKRLHLLVGLLSEPESDTKLSSLSEKDLSVDTSDVNGTYTVKTEYRIKRMQRKTHTHTNFYRKGFFLLTTHNWSYQSVSPHTTEHPYQ